jgi:hypothetical protein
MWIYAKNTDKDKTNIDMLIHTSMMVMGGIGSGGYSGKGGGRRGCGKIIRCLLQDLIVALEQIGNLASRNDQLVRIISM